MRTEELDEALRNAPCDHGALPEDHGPPKILVHVTPSTVMGEDGWQVVAECDSIKVFGERRRAFIAWNRKRGAATKIAEAFTLGLNTGYSIAVHNLTHDGRPDIDIHHDTAEPF
jgi:hypothetical protein